MTNSSDTRAEGQGTGPGAEPRPVRLANAGLTTKDLVFFVVAAAAPLTVMAGVVPLAIRTGGESAAYGYIVPGYGSDGALAFAGGDDVANMTFASITHYVGAWASDFGQILLCTSAFAAALAFHNAASRYFFALGRQGVLPTSFGRIHRRSGAPVGGTVAQTAVNALVLGLAMVLGADPYLVVFLWSAAPGVLGILALEALTALAVVCFFAKNLRGHSPWRVLVAPAIAAVGLVVLVWLSISQLDLLTAVGPAVNWSLLLPLPVLFLVGEGMALRIRRRDRARYESLGTEDVEG